MAGEIVGLFRIFFFGFFSMGLTVWPVRLFVKHLQPFNSSFFWHSIIHNYLFSQNLWFFLVFPIAETHGPTEQFEKKVRPARCAAAEVPVLREFPGAAAIGHHH